MQNLIYTYHNQLGYDSWDTRIQAIPRMALNPLHVPGTCIGPQPAYTDDQTSQIVLPMVDEWCKQLCDRHEPVTLVTKSVGNRTSCPVRWLVRQKT